jgi:hypothetical protein
LIIKKIKENTLFEFIDWLSFKGALLIAQIITLLYDSIMWLYSLFFSTGNAEIYFIGALCLLASVIIMSLTIDDEEYIQLFWFLGCLAPCGLYLKGVVFSTYEEANVVLKSEGVEIFENSQIGHSLAYKSRPSATISTPFKNSSILPN